MWLYKVLPIRIHVAQSLSCAFRQEALILARLQHPHILPIFDDGELDGSVFS